MRTWDKFDITIPYGATGEVRTTCPQCSPSRRKSRVSCLAVNIEKGTWFCHHCGWKGGLYGRRQPSTLLAPHRHLVRPDDHKRAILQHVWGEAWQITEGDPVHTYLRQRGIALSLTDLPRVLRYHPHLVYRH
jgi:hypothetical protein